MRDRKMTPLEHLVELRFRLLRAVLAVCGGTLVGSLITKPVIEWLLWPLGDSAVIVLGPTEAPIVYFKVSLWLGLLLALPYLLYQFYAFIKPGLYPAERKYFWLLIPGSLFAFLLGGGFTLGAFLPVTLPFLREFLPSTVQSTYSLEKYLSFVTTTLLSLGLIFQTPLVLYFLARVGLVQYAALRKARKLVIFGAALVAAIITPTTDPFVMLMVMLPFIALYEVGIWLARLAE